MTLDVRRKESCSIVEEGRDSFLSVFYKNSPVGVIVLAKQDLLPRWDWQIQLHAGAHGNDMPGLKLSGWAGTPEQALAAFRPAFERCLAHVGQHGWQSHLDHCAWLDAHQSFGDF